MVDLCFLVLCRETRRFCAEKGNRFCHLRIKREVNRVPGTIVSARDDLLLRDCGRRWDTSQLDTYVEPRVARRSHWNDSKVLGDGNGFSYDGAGASENGCQFSAVEIGDERRCGGSPGKDRKDSL